MRGSGKTFIGELVARTLSWTFVDADAYFETKHNIGVREFVHQNGWPAFRTAEANILEDLLTCHPTKHVISLGGGIVETPAARNTLKTYASKGGPVVQIVRHIDEMVEYLEKETARPAYGEPVADVFRRREPWFKECCNYQFVNLIGSPTKDDFTRTYKNRDEITRFFKHVTGVQANLAPNLVPGKRSYFLALTYPDITLALSHIDQLTAGVDAIEVRVDLLRSPKCIDIPGPYIPPTAYVADQLGILRRATSLPVVFTVRTVSQGGSFPDTAHKEVFELLKLGLSLGVEYVDVEISLPDKGVRELISYKGHSQIIASWHDWSGQMKWDSQLVKEKYYVADQLGDIIKLVGKANHIRDNFALYEFVCRSNSAPQAKPLIAINMGLDGKMSRILNATFSPVSHPLLPFKAAPGQLSFAEIQKALYLIGQLQPRRFYLFGNPIAHSMSPTLHNAAFEVLGLPHVYNLMETADVSQEIKATITSPDFGGASVTIPFKLDIMPLLDKLSPAAEALGAVNTIIPVAATPDGSSRILYGDNTDWIGIQESIQSRLPSGVIKAALVIGAGGTARAAIYALRLLGAQKIYLFNRTKAKAQALLRVFPDVSLEIVDSLDGTWLNEGVAPSVIISTIPANATTTDECSDSGLYLPSSLFISGEGQGVVVDMAYKPAETPLLSLAMAAGGERWSRVQGLDVLLEQGYVQFEYWTGRKCPKAIVRAAVWKKYLGTPSD
jgi:pentafunctional AROM polypeptide